MSGAESQRNPWTLFLIGLAGGGLISGVGVAALPEGMPRSVALWLTIGISWLACIGAVGWAYTEIRNQERLSPPKSDSKRILTYIGTLVFVALLAFAGATIPSKFAHTIWLVYVPLSLLVGWWVTRRKRLLSHRKARR